MTKTDDPPVDLLQGPTNSGIVIVGAGIAGLAAAHTLKKRGMQFTVLESESRVGGRIRTEELDGHIVDQGAQFLSSAYNNLLPIIKELGLGSKLLEVSPWIGFVRGGEIHRTRSNDLFSLLFSGAMKLDEWLHFILQGVRLMWSIRGHYSSWHEFDDLDAAEWLGTYFGTSARDHLFEPFFHGLYFQSLEGMSRAFVLAILSLGRSRPKTLILKGGLESMTRALASELRPNIRLNVSVQGLDVNNNGVVVRTDQHIIEADQVILATPAAISKTLFVQADGIEKRLMSTAYSPSILITIVIKDRNWRDVPSLKGVYGLLIPRVERKFIASVAIESAKDQNLKSNGEVLNVMLSGEKSFEMMDSPDDQIIVDIFSELERYFPNLTESSYAVHIQRWRAAMPTSPVGRSALIEQYRKRKKTSRIILAGDYMGLPYIDSAAETGIWATTILQN